MNTANDSVNGNWSYGYDPFNRVVSANQNSGQSVYSYVYDRFGNRWQQNGPHSFVTTFTGNNPSNPANTNRIDGYSYDTAGNLLGDGVHTYAYDAENRLTAVDGGSTASYIYGANGQRVRKTVSGSSVDFLYDLDGHEIKEVSSTGSWNRSEIYAGARHLATYGNNTTYFTQADWLGTERVRINVSGGIYETCTSLPFGDWLTCSNGDPSPMHFTSKERDAESGLDNFGLRYMGSNLGRFMSPDSIANDWELLNPQTWNRYAYARNNPLIYIDPDGAAVELLGDEEQRKKELAAIQASLGNKDAASRLYINEVKDGDNTRYFAGIKGDVGDFMKLGDTAHDLANIVQDKQVVEFGLTNRDLSQWGGGVTYKPGEDGGTNQNVRVLVNPEQAVDLASTILERTVLGAGRMGGQNERPPWRIRDMTEGIAVWHEFGHGWGYIHGRTGSRSNQEAVDWENRMRKQVYGPIGPNNAPRVRD